MTNFLSNEAPITILGGGISALSTAFFLIKVGHNPQKITINQKLDTWGGNARTVFVYQNKKEGLHGIMKYDMDVSNPFEPKLLLDLSLDCFNQFPKKALCEEFPERVIKNNKERIVVPLSNNHIIPAESAYIVNSSNYKNYRQIIKELNFYNAYWDNNTRSVITDEFRLDLKGFLYGLWKKPHLLPALIQMSRRLKKLNQASDNYLKKNNLKPDEVTVKKVFDGLGWSHSMYEKMTTIIISCLTGESTEKYNNTFSLNYHRSFVRLGLSDDESGVEVYTLGHGTTTSIYKIKHYLEEKGVSLNLSSTKEGENTVYAFHPWGYTNAFKSAKMASYLHNNKTPFSKDANGVDYCYSKKKDVPQHMFMNMSAVKPGNYESPVYATFSMFDNQESCEQLIKEGLNDPRKLVYAKDYQGESLNDVFIKINWKHPVITPEVEAVRKKIKAKQGIDNKWYVSASLEGAARHENAIESAIKAVILMKGEEAFHQLTREGFTTSMQLSDLKAKAY